MRLAEILIEPTGLGVRCLEVKGGEQKFWLQLNIALACGG